MKTAARTTAEVYADPGDFSRKTTCWRVLDSDGMVSAFNRVARLFTAAPHYQQARAEGTRQRWDLIQARLAGAGSLLDVGCAGGLMTRLAAGAGLFAVGLEANARVVRRAARAVAPGASAAFMHFRMTPESVASLPTFDAVLCLSVYHYWHREFGDAAAQRMLRGLGMRAARCLFFEPASRQKKYGRTPPAFVDGDERSIVEYNHRLLAGLFGGADRVECLGPTPCIGKEPYRYLFMVRTEHPGQPRP
jgi:SAM-dependent methyltransferase